MKFTAPVCLRLLKLFIASAVIFAFSSCSNAEEEGTVSLNIPSSVCEQLIARPPFSGTSSVAGATEMKVFLTGDHEARKTVWLTPGANITLQFDGIKPGSYVRLVCLIEGEYNESYDTVTTCKIFVGDEMPIYGKFKNAPKIKFETLSIGDDHGSTLSLSRDLPGCTYKWTYGSTEKTTSGNTCTYSDSNDTLGKSSCTIYCGGTEITTLSQWRA
ncbi:MAG: hypothetical protein J6Y30_09320 [Treponema sp.]|nr:hypothetical protein [Treponema sp.]